MLNQFAITYEDVTPESAEHGDASARGFELESIDIKSAMSHLRNLNALGYCEANGWPINCLTPPRWFTFYDVETDFTTGRVRSYSLHLPRSISPGSAMRIARLVNCRGA
jgi:hypothetical protein